MLVCPDSRTRTCIRAKIKLPYTSFASAAQGRSRIYIYGAKVCVCTSASQIALGADSSAHKVREHVYMCVPRHWMYLRSPSASWGLCAAFVQPTRNTYYALVHTCTTTTRDTFIFICIDQDKRSHMRARRVRASTRERTRRVHRGHSVQIWMCARQHRHTLRHSTTAAA